MPLEALLNFSVMSWILGSNAPCDFLSDCLNGRSAGAEAWALLPEAWTGEDTANREHPRM
jgi:hypothetical protein